MFGDKADRSLSTGSVASRPAVQTTPDDMTVRDTVAAADPGKVQDQPLPWANAATGSAGVVTAIRENNSSGHLCRDFVTTRHSFEGIASYAGQTCLSQTGQWLMTRFTRK